MSRLIAVFLILMALPLGAVIVETTASASALNGITALSDNVGDYAFSPVIGFTGFSSSLCNNFGSTEANIYSVALAQRLNYFYLYGGVRLQAIDGYHWQDQYMGAAIGNGDYGLGFGAHLDYNNVEEFDWSWDAALRAEHEGYGTEIKLLRMDSPDREVHLTAITRITCQMSAASTYVWDKTGASSYRVATRVDIMDELQFISSWQSYPSRIGAGINIQINSLRLGYGIRTHEDLNLTHSFDLSFAW